MGHTAGAIAPEWASLLSDVAEQAPVFLSAAGPDKRIVWFNRAALAFTGRTLEAELGAGWVDNVHPGDLSSLTVAYDQAFEARKPFQIEFRLKRHDGVWRMLSLHGTPRFDSDGNFVGYLGAAVDITEHRAAAEALRESEERFRGIADAAPVIIWIADANGECTWFNRSALEFTGRPMAAELGFGWVDNVHPADVEQTVSIFRAGYETRSAFRSTFRLRRADGAWRMLDETAVPRFASDGRFLGFIGSCTDVTDQVETAEALRQSEEQLRLATEASEVGFWDVDNIAGTLFWPARVKAMFGISAHVPVTLEDHFFPGLHPDDRDRVATAYAAAADPERRVLYDEEYRTIGLEDGVQRWVAAKGRGIFDENGLCVRVLGTAIDITARKAREQRQLLLASLGERFRDLDDPANVAFAAAESLGKALNVSRAGYGSIEGDYDFLVIERDWTAPGVESIAGRHDLRGAAAYMRALRQGGTMIVHDAAVDRRTASYADAARAANAMAFINVPITEQGGLVAVLFLNNATPRQWTPDEIAFVEEVAERTRTTVERRRAEVAMRQAEQRFRHELEEKVAQRTRELQESIAARVEAEQALQQALKMEAIGNLTGGIAHDFNNLLMAVLGSLELLRKRMPNEPALLRLLDNAAEGARRGSALTQRMLAFARRQELQSQRIDLVALVGGMTDLLRRAAGPMISLDVVLPESLPAVETDPNQLESALLNLVLNARDAIDGTGEIQISVREEIRGSDGTASRYVCLSVSDTGTGMDEATLKRASEPFFTTKGIGKGTGLGLSMVHGFAEQSGGLLQLKSEPGKGTTVEIRLPAASMDTAAAPVLADLPAGAANADGIGIRYTVLAVDDDPLVLMNTAAMLEDLGHEVVEAHSAKEALVLLGTRPFDLVITDHAMPQMTGVQLSQEIQKRQPGLPIILATGYAELPAGAESALPRLAKPFTQHDLAEALGKAARLPGQVGA